jgi:thioredoxin reductase (NADPH)
MGKPVILAVDDDVSVLEMVVQDLRRQYGANYRIQRAASGQAALDTCDQLKKRGDTVALFVSDQRMPGMSGVEFLGKAMEYFPDAKRALLTAYADTEAAIQAINTAKINYYLTKPWDPPEERLYPVLNDLLETWKEGYKPPFEGLRVVGPRYTLRDHQVRDFLSRNQVPYVWLDPEQSAKGWTCSPVSSWMTVSCRWSFLGMAPIWCSRAKWNWPPRSGCAPRRPRSSTTW